MQVNRGVGRDARRQNRKGSLQGKPDEGKDECGGEDGSDRLADVKRSESDVHALRAVDERGRSLGDSCENRRLREPAEHGSDHECQNGPAAVAE